MTFLNALAACLGALLLLSAMEIASAPRAPSVVQR
jgi:hypothetical protein